MSAHGPKPILLVIALWGASSLVTTACDAEPAAPTPIFETAELGSWRELRDCRGSHEHELRYVRVLASPDAEDPYIALSAQAPYPIGARLVKLEYDEADCVTPIGYTAMQKLPAGASPEGGDWLWQDLDARARVLEEGPLFRCVNCHTHHCDPPFNGYDLTCAEEL